MSKHMKKFRLHYHISNGGDGSASLRLHPNAEIAAAEDEKQNESGDGWAEESADHKEILLINEKLYYKNIRYNPELKKFEDNFVELEELK